MCTFCDDTGSLSKHVTGHLDCPYCDAAGQRADLEAWYKTVKHEYIVQDLLWLAIQRSQAEAVTQ
jgi:hypothetical protein